MQLLGAGPPHYKTDSKGRQVYQRADGKWVPVSSGETPGYTPPAGQQAQGTPGGGPPVDPMLEAQKAAAQRTIQLGDAWDAYSQSQLQSTFGYTASGGIDPSNPYSRAMHAQNLYNRNNEDLQRNYGRTTEDIARQLGITKNSNTINMASAGQLNAGSYLNAQNFAQDSADRTTGRLTEDFNTNKTRSSQDYGYASNDLKQQLASALGGILKGKVDRYSQVGADVDQNTLNSLIKALGG